MDEVTAALQQTRDRLTALAHAPSTTDDAARVDQIRALEEIKAAAAAAQAAVTAAFAASQRAAQAAAGVPAERVGRGITTQVALARRCSPHRATRETGWARILTTELPAVFTALAAGQTTEWRALLIARETGWLSREHRAAVDTELASRLEGWGDKRVEAETKRLAYRLDPHGYVKRIRDAATDRRVSVRPAPDGMSRLSALLPVAQGVACYAALTRAADTARAVGEPGSRGQVMADTLVQRVTGQAAADAVPVEIQLVMTDHTLLNAGSHADEPAFIPGHGPVPADIARDLAYRNGAHDTPGVPRWIRRLFTDPATGHLVGVDTRRRLFVPAQQRFLQLRDQTCRTPYCDAPVRHADHITAWINGGRTTVDDGRGTCEACNYAGQAPGWRGRAAPDGSIETTTPTGHTYRSPQPDLPGTPPRPPTGAASPDPDQPPRYRVRRERRRRRIDVVYFHAA